MKSNDESSNCGSSKSGSLVSGASSSSSTYNFVTFKKPPRNYIITNESINDQKLARQKRKQQINENEREQRRLDVEVILSGFPVKPVAKTIVEKFLSIQNVPIQKVKGYHQFESVAKGYNRFEEIQYFIVIIFKEKSTKSKLCKTIRWSQLSDNNQDRNPIITCNDRLCKFNLGVKKQLEVLKAKGIIEEYQFKDVFFNYKQTPVSEWKVVSMIDDINHLIDLLKYTK